MILLILAGLREGVLGSAFRLRMPESVIKGPSSKEVRSITVGTVKFEKNMVWRFGPCSSFNDLWNRFLDPRIFYLFRNQRKTFLIVSHNPPLWKLFRSA